VRFEFVGEAAQFVDGYLLVVAVVDVEDGGCGAVDVFDERAVPAVVRFVEAYALLAEVDGRAQLERRAACVLVVEQLQVVFEVDEGRLVVLGELHVQAERRVGECEEYWVPFGRRFHRYAFVRVGQIDK